MITEVGRQGLRHSISGLRDPLASEPAAKVNGRVTYSQLILKEFGWIDKAVGRGVDTAGSGYSQI